MPVTTKVRGRRVTLLLAALLLIAPEVMAAPRSAAEELEKARAAARAKRYDEAIEDYLRPLFQQHYTMSFENYPVDAERLHGLEVVDRSK
mgnify:CR=1 FL=1